MAERDSELTREVLTYFKDIKDRSILTREEEAALSERIKAGDRSAVNELVSANLKFVVNVAKEFRGKGVPFPDLIAEGNMGLMRAAEKFDASKGTKFITYAIWWIKSAILDCISEHRAHDAVELNGEISVSREDLLESMNDSGTYTDESIKQESVKRLMECLQDREASVVTMTFGLGGMDPLTLDEVGEKMGLTQERVRQIREHAIMKMKCHALMLSKAEFESFSELN